jgi:hypothetical protein
MPARYAPGRLASNSLFPSSTFFSSMAAVTGHTNHDLLCQAHWPCSVMLLASAC